MEKEQSDEGQGGRKEGQGETRRDKEGSKKGQRRDKGWIEWNKDSQRRDEEGN